MFFQQPVFLWGLWALAVPILIHLFDFRKNKKVYFPDIQFLKQVKHSAKKPLRIKHWLTLLARLGFIFFLVMAFAQPKLPTTKQEQIGRGVTAIYIDNSMSMLAPGPNGQSLLDNAKSLAVKLLSQFSKEQEVVVFTNDWLHQFSSETTKAQVIPQLSGIQPSNSSLDWQGLQTGLHTYQKQSSKRVSDVFIFSDFQKSTWKFSAKVDTTRTFWLAPALPASYTNAVVDSVFQEPALISNPNVTITAVLQNTGNELVKDLPVKVFLGSRQVSASTTTLNGFQKMEVSFDIGKVSNAQPGFIQVEDAPNTFDNRFYFTINPPKKWHIFSINGDRPSQYVKKVFGNKMLFNWASGYYKNIDNTSLIKADLIVLNQVRSLSIQLINKIKMMANNGVMVCVVPSPKVDITAYINLYSHLKSVQDIDKLKLLPPNADHPFYKNILEGNSSQMDMPRALPVWGWGNDKSGLLYFENGMPYLSELLNHIYVYASPLTDSLSEFQSHALFVPIMYQIVAQAAHPQGNLFFRVSTTNYKVGLDSIGVNELLKMKIAELEIIPEKRKSGHFWELSFPEAMRRVGNYSIENKGKVIGFLALNGSVKESQLEPYTKKDLSQLLSGYKLKFLDTDNQNTRVLSNFNGGFPLWKYALIISLLFLLLETLLIRML